MSGDLKIQAACTRTGCSMFAGGICTACGMEVPAGYGESSDDLKKRLQYCSAYGTTARERIAATLGLSRIAELEAQLKAVREALADEAAFEAAWAMRPLDLNESSGKSRAWFWWQKAIAALDPKPTATGETP